MTEYMEQEFINEVLDNSVPQWRWKQIQADRKRLSEQCENNSEQTLLRESGFNL